MVDIKSYDPESGSYSTNSMFIDKKAYEGTYDYACFNYENSSNPNVTYVKRKLTILEYEQLLNESKGKIKLLQKQYVDQFEKELQSLLKLKYN